MYNIISLSVETNIYIYKQTNQNRDEENGLFGIIHCMVRVAQEKIFTPPLYCILQSLLVRRSDFNEIRHQLAFCELSSCVPHLLSWIPLLRIRLKCFRMSIREIRRVASDLNEGHPHANASRRNTVPKKRRYPYVYNHTKS